MISLETRGADFGDGSLNTTYRNVSQAVNRTEPRTQAEGIASQQVILSVMGIPGALLAGWMVEQRYLGRKGTLAISTGTSIRVSSPCTTS